MLPINSLTVDDVDRLRKASGTNGRSITLSDFEIQQVYRRLQVLFPKSRIQWSFAEKVAFHNKAN